MPPGSRSSASSASSCRTQQPARPGQTPYQRRETWTQENTRGTRGRGGWSRVGSSVCLKTEGSCGVSESRTAPSSDAVENTGPLWGSDVTLQGKPLARKAVPCQSLAPVPQCYLERHSAPIPFKLDLQGAQASPHPVKTRPSVEHLSRSSRQSAKASTKLFINNEPRTATNRNSLDHV